MSSRTPARKNTRQCPNMTKERARAIVGMVAEQDGMTAEYNLTPAQIARLCLDMSEAINDIKARRRALYSCPGTIQ